MNSEQGTFLLPCLCSSTTAVDLCLLAFFLSHCRSSKKPVQIAGTANAILEKKAKDRETRKKAERSSRYVQT